MSRIALAALLALTACQTAAPMPAPSVADLAPVAGLAPADDPWHPVRFLSGTWQATDDAGTSMETWSEPSGSAMYGQNRSTNGSHLVFFELLTIERRDDSFIYLASPKGSPATAFAMTSNEVNSDGAAVTFENQDHDFPKRISYRLNANGVLSARVDDGTDNGKNLRFTLQRVQ
jgi:hypothetical protein